MNLKLTLTGGADGDGQELQREIITRTESLFVYARDVIGEDLFLLGEQIKRKNAALPIEDLTWIRGGTLSVNCEMEGKG